MKNRIRRPASTLWTRNISCFFHGSEAVTSTALNDVYGKVQVISINTSDSKGFPAYLPWRYSNVRKVHGRCISLNYAACNYEKLCIVSKSNLCQMRQKSAAFSTESMSENDHRNRLFVSSFPLDQAKDIEWLESKTEELLSTNEINEEIKSSYEVLSGDYAKAMKAWSSLHLTSDRAAIAMESLLCRLLEVLGHVVYDCQENEAKSVASGLVVLHNLCIDGWSKSRIKGSGFNLHLESC